MKSFLDNDFLLNSQTAKTLYHDYASKMPVIDYHCHVNPKEIALNRRFENLTQAWLEGDHYKWRLMRAVGEDEKFITGKESSDYEKFLAFARTLPQAAGNPVYTWTHLELKRYFDCGLALSPDTAEEIWRQGNEKLAGEDMSVRGIIARSRVTAIATTDDPTDSLEWHKEIKDSNFSVTVVPAFRPDKAINIDKPGFTDYLNKLGEAAGLPIKAWRDLLAALKQRLDYFGQYGCRASDHGLDYVPFFETTEKEAAEIFHKALSGDVISSREAEGYKTALLLFLGREYAKRGWVMQLHYGAMRNVNSGMFKKLGPDTGNDAVSGMECSKRVANLLDCLEKTGELPKTVLYSLNPNDNIFLQTIGGCFNEAGVAGKVQHGSAWWFNDTKPGMEAQLINLANCGLLGGFIGMLTDSRSFLSYTRHEYFRRILCNLIGKWVENGEYPRDIKTLGEMAQNISYHNTAKFFRFK
jgi:glucuronate isomerase